MKVRLVGLWLLSVWTTTSGQGFGTSNGEDPSFVIDDPVAYELGKPRACNQRLGIVTPETVRLAGRRVLENFLEGDLLERSLDIILLPATGDFEVVKICASCKNHHDWFFQLGSKKFPGYHASYCSSNTTGYTVAHSSLAFIPLDRSGSIPDRVKLRPFLSLASNRVDPSLAPTKAFPVDSLPLYLNETASAYFLYTYLPSMVAASAGAVALLPDPAGTGTSEDRVHRTMFHKFNYDRVTAISYLALKRYIIERTKECTLLDEVASVHGANDGAFGALYATQILQRFGVDVLGSFVQAGPLNLEKWIKQSLDGGFTDNVLAQEWMQVAAYTFSGGISGIRNTGSGSYLASDDYRIALVDKFGPIEDRIESTFEFPNNPADLLNQNVRDVLSKPVTSPCANEFDSILCSVILEASAYQVMLGETDRRWSYPLHTCFSGGDEILSLNQLEDTDFVDDAKLQTLWSRYNGPVGFDGLSLEKARDHDTTLLLCAVEPALFFTLQGHRPDNEDDWPNRQVPLNANELRFCRSESNKPTMSPIGSGNGNDNPLGSGAGTNGGEGSQVSLSGGNSVQTTDPENASPSPDSPSNPSSNAASFTLLVASLSVAVPLFL